MVYLDDVCFFFFIPLKLLLVSYFCVFVQLNSTKVILKCASSLTDVLPSLLPSVTNELVMLSLDLVKTRLSVMSMEMRKNFIQVILTSLIEKSPDPKILRSVVKIVEEWVKNNSPMAANQVVPPICLILPKGCKRL